MWLVLLCVAAKQPAEEANYDGPEGAKREWSGGDGFCFRFGGFDIDGLRFFSNLQVLFHSRRELAKHLSRHFLDHAASELDDLANEIDIGVYRNLATSTGKRRDRTQHRDLRRSRTRYLARVANIRTWCVCSFISVNFPCPL